jgi:hypothetical protein
MDTDFAAIIRAHWRRFVWMWVFPLAFLATVLVPAFSRSPFAFFLIVDLPVLFLCYYIASKPVRSREITVGQGVILVILVPFVLWAVMIFGLFGIASWLGGAGSR